MEHDCFAILGLTPGPYSRDLIRQRFVQERAKCLDALRGSEGSSPQRRLEAVHMAYKLLDDPERQARHLAAVRDGRLNEPRDHVRDLVAAALEDGLLRYSRRQEIIRIGRVLGLSEFQVHLLIAEVQVGAVPAAEPTQAAAKSATRQQAADQIRYNLIAAGLLGLGLFFSAISWLGF